MVSGVFQDVSGDSRGVRVSRGFHRWFKTFQGASGGFRVISEVSERFPRFSRDLYCFKDFSRVLEAFQDVSSSSRLFQDVCQGRHDDHISSKFLSSEARKNNICSK